MKLKTLFLPFLLITSMFLMASAPLQEPAPPGVLVYVQLAAAAFAALIGWPALLATVVTALEYFGWLAMASADKFIFWANVLAFGGIFVAALLGKIDLVNVVDSTFGNFAQLLVYVLILLGVPIGFERAKASEEKIRAASFFQASARLR